MGTIYCIYSGRDGRSHFSDAALALKADAIGNLSTGLLGAKGWMYAESPAGRFVDWHTAGPGGVSVMLDGWMELETGGGEKRRLVAGDLLLALDTSGQGHRSTLGPNTRGLSLMFDAPAQAVMQSLFGRDLAD
jgi:hypothetical protein